VRCDAAVCVSDAASDACTHPTCAPDLDAGDARVCSGPRELTRQRLDLLLVVDSTASIVPWWFSLSEGVNQFFEDEASAGVGVGLQLFGQMCGAQSYVTPVVSIAPLPGNLSALQAVEPPLFASTSTIPALDGALQHARAWAAANRSAHVAVVLLTDVTTGECDALTGDPDAEAMRIAQAAYTDTPSIPTYVVGFGSMALLSTLARAGGTELLAISITPASGEVATALGKVRDQMRPCAFAWPSDAGLAADSAIVVTAADGSERSYPLQRASSACDQQPGFYVEDETAEFPVIACPRLCASLGSALRIALSNACSAP
jgi:hypothetical protein